MNFRQLIEREARHEDPTARPRKMGEMAAACGVSRAHLYNLMKGAKRAQAWTVSAIALGLEVDVEVVDKALLQSREEVEA